MNEDIKRNAITAKADVNYQSGESFTGSTQNSSGLMSDSGITVIENTQQEPIHRAEEASSSPIRTDSCGSRNRSNYICHDFENDVTPTTSLETNTREMKWKEKGSSSNKQGRKKRSRRTISKDSVTKRSDFGEYYPDGGWGWVICGGAVVVNCLCYGLHLAGGSTYLAVVRYMDSLAVHIDTHPALTTISLKPPNATGSTVVTPTRSLNTYELTFLLLTAVAPLVTFLLTVLLPSISWGVCLALAPIVTAWCRRHSPRLLALFGAIVCGLGLLFLSFSQAPHQFFISYAVFYGIGSGIVLQTSNVMISRFFRKRRECAELVVLSAVGVGVAVMSVFIQLVPRVTTRWMNGIQLLGCLMLPVVAAVATYRSTALYHPFRQAILHLKNSQSHVAQKEFNDKPPYWDVTPLYMCSLQMLLLCVMLIGFGLYVPFVLLPVLMEAEKTHSDTIIVIMVFMGISVSLGVSSSGLLVLCSSTRCHVAKQYLTMSAGALCGISTLFFAIGTGMQSYVLYALIYGWAYGAFFYSLKMYVIEIVRRKLSEMAYSYVLAFLSIGAISGPPLAELLNQGTAVFRAGFITAGTFMLIGSSLLFIVSLTSSHPSNQRVIKRAYIKAKLKEEKISGVINASPSASSSDTGSHSWLSGTGGAKTPEEEWNELASITPMSAADKVGKYLSCEELNTTKHDTKTTVVNNIPSSVYHCNNSYTNVTPSSLRSNQTQKIEVHIRPKQMSVDSQPEMLHLVAGVTCLKLKQADGLALSTSRGQTSDISPSVPDVALTHSTSKDALDEARKSTRV